jgi:phage-related protein
LNSVKKLLIAMVSQSVHRLLLLFLKKLNAKPMLVWTHPLTARQIFPAERASQVCLQFL